MFDGFTLTRMHNVLVPNIAKRGGKRVPSPQKISYNNHIKTPHTMDLRNHELSLCNKRRRWTLLFSLWELIRLERIYNFWCSMLVFYPITYVFYMFPFIFRLFSWTNLLTRCPVPVSVFCCFCISEKFLKKYSRNGLKIHGHWFLPQTKTESKGEPEGGQGATRRAPGAASP